MDATMSVHAFIASRLTAFRTGPHNHPVSIGTPRNLLALALLLAVGLVLMPRGAQAHGLDHAAHQQQYGGHDAQNYGHSNGSSGSQVHDRSPLAIPVSAVATHCPGGPGSSCCCQEKTAAVSAPLAVAAVADRVLLVPFALQHRLHLADACPFVFSHLLKSSPARAPPPSL
jgi:hypothetical protein